MFMMIPLLLGTGHCYSPLNPAIVNFRDGDDRFYDSNQTEKVKDYLIGNYSIYLSKCYDSNSDIICYNNGTKSENKGNPFKILLLGGFYTHPVTPVLLLRCAEFFAVDPFEELIGLLEIHIWPIVNKGGFNHMFESSTKNPKMFEEVKTNYVNYKNCKYGINIDRNFEENFEVNNTCGDFYSSDKPRNTNETLDVIDLIKSQNYSVIFNFQGWEGKDPVIPYAYKKKEINDTDLKFYKQILGRSYETYYEEYKKAYGTFIDTAFKYGSYPVYISLKNQSDYKELKDLDNQCRAIKEYIMESIEPPLGKVVDIHELESEKTVRFSYKLTNYMPFKCKFRYEMKFYFNKKGKYNFSKCEIVDEDDVLGKCSSNKTFLSSEKLGGIMYNTILFEHEGEADGYSSHAFNISFSKKKDNKDSTMKLDLKIYSQTGGFRFNTILDNSIYDIRFEVDEFSRSYIIMISVLGAFFLIIFIIILA